MAWSDADIAYLKANWWTKTASAIAAALGRGKTRNAVIGKAYRLGLPAKAPGPGAYITVGHIKRGGV